MVNHHTRLPVGGLFHQLYRYNIHGNVLTTTGFPIIGGQLSRLGDGIVRGCATCAGNDHMRAVHLAGVKPNIVLSGHFEGQLIVLPVVPSHINGIAVDGLKAHRGQLGNFHFPLAGILFQISTGLQFLPNLLQLCVRIRPIQFV